MPGPALGRGQRSRFDVAFLLALGGTDLLAAGRRLGRSTRLAVSLALVVGAPAGALAGAWTLPQGSGLLIETLYGWVGDGPPSGGNPPGPQSPARAQP